MKSVELHCQISALGRLLMGTMLAAAQDNSQQTALDS
jgi:hypothetical protein